VSRGRDTGSPATRLGDEALVDLADVARSLRDALSCRAARRGRLHCPDDARAEPREADVTPPLLLSHTIGLLVRHGCDGRLRQACTDRLATRRSWGWSPSVPPCALPFAQDCASPATWDTACRRTASNNAVARRRSRLRRQRRNGAFPDDVVKGIVRLVSRPFGPGATRPS